MDLTEADRRSTSTSLAALRLQGVLVSFERCSWQMADSHYTNSSPTCSTIPSTTMSFAGIAMELPSPSRMGHPNSSLSSAPFSVIRTFTLSSVSSTSVRQRCSVEATPARSHEELGADFTVDADAFTRLTSLDLVDALDGCPSSAAGEFSGFYQ